VRSLLQPVDVAAIDVDPTDSEQGLLVAPYPPDATVLPGPPPAPLEGLLLLRGPLAGVGRPATAAGMGGWGRSGDGTNPTLAPTIIPWPSHLPSELRDPNIVQLAHLPPHHLMFTFGRYNCIADEIYSVALDDEAGATEPLKPLAPPTQLVSALLKPYSGMLQSRPDGKGGVELSWTKCASRVVFADVPRGAAVGAPVDYEQLRFAWLDIPIPGQPSISSFARVGNTFVFIYSTKFAIYSAELVADRHVFEHVTLLSNDSAWLPLATTAHGSTVYISERNATAYSSVNANGRIRSIDLAKTPANGPPSGAGGAKLKVYVADTVGVDELSTMPASCLPPPLVRAADTPSA
jgi:hypothetical protein